MKKNFSILAMAVVASAFTSCATAQDGIVPSKNYVTKKVKVGKFDGISTATSIDVAYTQTSGSQDIEIFAPDNLVDYVNVAVEEGMLKVRFCSEDSKQGLSIKGDHKTEVRVSAPAVHIFRTSSNGDIVLKNGLQTDGEVNVKSSSNGDVEGGTIVCGALVATASSNGDITLEGAECTSLDADASSNGDVSIKHIKAETVEADASSNGDVNLSGVCRSAKLTASSNGDVEAKNLKADVVVAKASSTGDVTCCPIESLDATTSSNGSVNYKGDPKQINYHPKKGLKKID